MKSPLNLIFISLVKQRELHLLMRTVQQSSSSSSSSHLVTVLCSQDRLGAQEAAFFSGFIRRELFKILGVELLSFGS